MEETSAPTHVRPESRPRRVAKRRGFRLTAIATAATVGASLTLVSCITGDTKTAAGIVPENAQAFATLALNPSLGQKKELLGLSRRFPAKAQANDLEDLKAKVINDLLKDEGLNYEADVKPWLGDEAAAAVLPPASEDEEPVPVALLRTKDEAKTRAAFEKKKLPATSFAFIDDYAVVVETDVKAKDPGPKAIAAITAASKDKSLKDNPRFTKSIGQLNGGHLAQTWIDMPALYKSVRDSDSAKERDLPGASIAKKDSATEKQLAKQFDDLGAITLQLYATSSSFVVEGVSEKSSPNTQANATGKGELLSALPAGTFAAVNISDTTQLANDLSAWLTKQVTSDTAVAVSELKTALGTLDGEGVLTMGKPAAAGDFPLAIIAKVNNPSRATGALDKVVDQLKARSIPVVVTPTSDGKSYDLSVFLKAAATQPTAGLFSGLMKEFVISVEGDKVIVTNSKSYLTDFTNGGTTLDGSDELKAAIDKPLTKANLGGVYVDIAGIINWYNDTLSSGKTVFGTKAAASDKITDEWATSLKVVGQQSWFDHDREHFEARLAFK